MGTAGVFRTITEVLDANDVAYMLAGSFASTHYGTSRSTQDLDLVIDPTDEQLGKLTESLKGNNYYLDLNSALEAKRRESLFNIIDRETGWKIDLIFRKSRPFSKEEFSRRSVVLLQGFPVYVASAEDVIISKLEGAKLGQSQCHTEDAAAILRIRRDGLDESYLERWVSELELAEQWRNANPAARGDHPRAI